MSDIQIAIDTLQREHPDWVITEPTFFENRAVHITYPSEGFLDSNYSASTVHQINYYPSFGIMSYEMADTDTGDEPMIACYLDEELYSFSRLLYTLTKELRDEHYRNQEQSKAPVQQQNMGLKD